MDLRIRGVSGRPWVRGGVSGGALSRRRSGPGAVCCPGRRPTAGGPLRTCGRPRAGANPRSAPASPPQKNNPSGANPRAAPTHRPLVPLFSLSLSIAQCLQLLHLVLTTRRQHPHPHPHPHPHRRRRRRHHHHQPCWQQCLLLLLLLLLCLTATAPTGLAARATCRPA